MPQAVFPIQISSIMGRPKRLYPLGRYRLHVRGEIDPAKQYLVQLEYTWNRQMIRKGMNIFVRLGDWNEKANKGRGGVRASYGPEANRINSLLLARADKIDGLLAEYQEKHPNQITAQVIADFLADKPLTREDKGKDFIEFVLERLESDYSRSRIGRSRYENGKSGMNIFRIFLRATKNGTYKPDSIYLGEISVELIDEYIRWRREIKQNSDATINHALTPILKACAYASEMKMIDHAVNARIQDMRIASKISLADEDNEFDGKYLSKDTDVRVTGILPCLHRTTPQGVSGDVFLCLPCLRTPCGRCDDPAMEAYRFCPEGVAEDHDQDKQTSCDSPLPNLP